MIHQLMFTSGDTATMPVLSTTGNINTSGGTIDDAFDGSGNTFLYRSQLNSTNNHQGSMIFTWPTAISVNSTIKIGVAMGSSNYRTTAVNITDVNGNTHVTSVTNLWNGTGPITAVSINHTYPSSTIKIIEFFNSYNPAAVSQIEIDGSILIY